MPASKQNSAAPTSALPRNATSQVSQDGGRVASLKSTPTDSSPLPNTNHLSLPRPQGDAPAPPVNRKKQKRRQKAAARVAAEQLADDNAPPLDAPPRPDHDAVSDEEDGESLGQPPPDALPPPTTNGHSGEASKSKKAKKKKKKNVLGSGSSAGQTPSATTTTDSPANMSMGLRGSGMSRDKIWSNSNQEERERIKEFWLGLGEDDRKSLVKVEKDAVLKKMKEQQKHTCSCTVCGRKRTAIEEELEGLYDAYYLELEQFANQGEGPPLLQPPPLRELPMQPPPRLPSQFTARVPLRGRMVEHVGEDDEEEIDGAYSEDEVDEDEFSDDEEPPEEFHSSHDRDVADFLTFGNSLQVKGGILTVADDLLKNDGKRFIEMMEQLAERRMAREEDAREHFARAYAPPNGSYSAPHNHTHAPPPEEEEYEEEEEEEEDDYEDSQEEEYEDEEDSMTEEARMEEGRRMFQIFAARMFEQRVLSAYKEKVAKERQQKLLEELEEESRQVDEQKAKKAKNAQKKKDKAAQKKQAQAEEKARKEAERAAEEAARAEEEQRRAAEQRQRAEEKRKQKEAQRKAEDEARLKREAERQRRIHEQKEKQAEQERRAREAKERERKAKEETRLREQEAREQREREAQERKEKQERDKREKEARAAKAQREAQREAREAAAARDRAKEEKAAAHKAAQSSKRQSGSQGHGTVLPQHAASNAAAAAAASFASPKVPVATPAIPKAPTPMKPRAVSQAAEGNQASASVPPPPPPPLQWTMQSSPAPAQQTQAPTTTPLAATPVQSGPGSIGQERKGSIIGFAPLNQHQQQHQQQHVNRQHQQHAAQSTSPPSSQPNHTPSQGTPFQMPAMTMQPPPGLGQQRPPGFGSPISPEPMFALGGFRPGPMPNMMIPPPGMNNAGGRNFTPMPMPPPGFAQGAGPSEQFAMTQGFGLPKDMALPTHNRQGSAGLDGAIGAPAQPIGRPAPIRRPGSVSQVQARVLDENPRHLGSRVLVEEEDAPSSDAVAGGMRSQLPDLRGAFAPNHSQFLEASLPMGHGPWGHAGGVQPFGSPGFGNATWASPTMPPGFSVGSPASGLVAMRPPAQPRHVAVRLMLCQACKDLANTTAASASGFIDLGLVKSHIETLSGDLSITEQDLLNLCDTEGNASNGGGAFDVRHHGDLAHAIRWAPDAGDGLNPHYRAVGAPGEIGSPLASQASLRGI
ncbi:hypothetical protein CDD81_3438 [Ophiocordyceps australis]|uniref:Stress response protein NST1 n=1 Tax=Ophiocordyceps australis TaxID=1399860 RepID=A0A2C5YC43_9HYPO|nr:hypothetical protein CDD81_3438 [Ophiocordyceps australis]